MIPNPDTLARIREQAEGHARGLEGDVPNAYRELVRRAFVTGADAGYTAALAERREK